MKTYDEIGPSSMLFDAVAVSGIKRKANPKFWYQFVRYGQRLTRFSDCIRVHPNEHDPESGIRDGFYWEIKKNRALSIVETYHTEEVSHYMVSCASRLREPRISRVTAAGFVLSIARNSGAAALPFVTRLPGDILPRWFRLIQYGLATLLGLPFIAAVGLLIASPINEIDFDSKQLFFFALGLPLTAGMLVTGLLALRGEYIAFKRGLSPVEAELKDASNAAQHLLDSLSSAKRSNRFGD